MTEIEGKKFGKLTAIRFLEWRVYKNGKRHQVWEFRCDCGKTTSALLPNVKKGHTQSCGCYLNQRRIESHTKHGDAKKGQLSKLYIVWNGMLQRCRNPKYRWFHRWGGRGIKVQWASYEDFKRDMEDSYREGLEIDRINNDGDYSKENCRWATQREQALNRRSNVLITFRGETMPMGKWAERFGLNQKIVGDRIRKGWSVEKALTTPVAGA
jgi:hypothetical protein